MKYFVIGDDSNYIYDNHPNDIYGNVICLPMAISQLNCKHWFRERYTSLSCRDNTKLAFELVDVKDKESRELTIAFLVASSEGETETFLRSQLDLVHHLLLMEYGPSVLYNRNKISTGFFQSQENQRIISNLIHTTCKLADRKQSFLVQAVENLLPFNSNPKTEGDILSILAKYAVPSSCHILLFVGTKQIAHYAKPKVFPLSAQDIFLLILFYMSHSGNMDIDNDGINSDSSDLSDSEGFNNRLLQPWDVAQLHEIFSSGVGEPYSHPIVEALQVLLQQIGIKVQSDGKITEKFLVILSTSGLIPDGQDFINLSTLIITLEQFEKYPIEKKKMEVSPGVTILKLVKMISNVVEFEKKDQENSPNSPPPLPPIPNPVPRKASKSDTFPTYRELYYQTYTNSHPYYTYINHLYKPNAEDMSPITLVIISKDMTGTEAEKQSMIEIEKKIKKNMEGYFEYLVSLENTISMITYVNQLPGLVHFILVDRTDNKVMAPAITPMFGPQSKLSKNKKAKREVMKLLKRSIWDLCYESQEFLARGYFTMVMKCGNFQYYYCLWFETNTGTPLPITSDFDWDPKKPLNQQFYNHIQSIMQEKYSSSSIKCYEIYGLYLKFLPLKVVEQHSQVLVNSLLRVKQ